jgi:hypothetical protein
VTNHKSARTVRITLLAFAGVSAAVPASAGPLMDATKRDNVQRVEQIVHSGADVDEQGLQGDMPLHWAAFQGSTSVVAHLIAGGAEVNARVRDGNTPLHQASYRGHLDVVELLIRHGAAVNARTHAGITPLDWAIQNRHKDVQRLLIAYGAKPGRISVNKPFGRQQDRLPVMDPVDMQQDNVMLAALQALPSVRSIAGQRATVAEAQHSIPEPSTPPTQTQQFRVQLVAMSNEAGARRMWETFRSRHREVLDGLNLALEPAEVDGRSYYRVQAGPLSRAEAVSTCNSLAQSGQSCLIVEVGGTREFLSSTSDPF